MNTEEHILANPLFEETQTVTLIDEIISTDTNTEGWRTRKKVSPIREYLEPASKVVVSVRFVGQTLDQNSNIQ